HIQPGYLGGLQDFEARVKAGLPPPTPSYGGGDRIWIYHNTYAGGQFVDDGRVVAFGGSRKGMGYQTCFKFNDNLSPIGNGQYGIMNNDTGAAGNFTGSDGLPGVYSTNSGCPQGEFWNNVLFGDRNGLWRKGYLSPTGRNGNRDDDSNIYPPSYKEVRF